MKKVYTYLREISLIIALLVLATSAGWGQDYTDADGKIHITNPRFPRKAMVRPDCLVNTMINVITVLEDQAELSNLVDRELDNYTETKSVANISLLTDPVVRVKDRKHYYPAGTKAGFCIRGTGEEGAVLSVDLLKTFFIIFYKDGKKVGSAPVNQAGSSDLLRLDVIQLEGSEEARTYLEAEAPKDIKEFDEIALMIGGAEVGALSLSGFKICYAFVGDAQEHILTNYEEGNCPEFLKGITSVEEKRDTWYEGLPIDLGYYVISTPGIEGTEGKLIDNDKESALEFFTLLSVDLLGVGGPNPGVYCEGELFPAGTEVGFEYDAGGLLGLGIARGSTIVVQQVEYESTWLGENKKVIAEEEIDLASSVLGLGLLEGIDGSGTKTKVSVIPTIPFNEVHLKINPGVGASLIKTRSFYYAYVCEPTVLPEEDSSIEGISMDASIVENTFYLRPQGDWTFLKASETLDGDPLQNVNVTFSNGTDTKGNPVTIVSGLDEVAYYTFSLTTSDGKSGTVTLNHGVKTPSQCNIPLQDDEYELGTDRHLDGGISILEGIKNQENVIDGDNNTYAEYMAGINLLSNKHIIGVRKKSGGKISDGTDKRIGFLVEVEDQVLDVKALSFFRFQLFNNGQPIDSKDYVADDWNVISAGLIGTSTASKARLGVTIPGDVEFDEFALYTAGILELHLSSPLRIYSAFVEEAEWDCDNPLGCDVVYAGEKSEAHINYNETHLPQGISIGSGMTGLENLISGEEFDPKEKDKCVQFFGTLNAIGSTVIAVDFGAVMSKTHQVGFVIDKETYLLNADVISGVVISTYLNGIPTGDEYSSWSVLGANVIGYGDYTYLKFTPTQAYDEARIEFPAVASFLSSIKIYSVFTLNDSDGDGIPDCKDPETSVGGLSDISVSPEDICVGDGEIILSALPNYNGEKEYIFKIKNGADEKIEKKVSISGGSIYQDVILTEEETKQYGAGQYTLDVIVSDGTTETTIRTLNFTIHPTRTKWIPTEPSTDWNEWTNWSDGSPWTCTDVIIPSDADTYPVLKSGVMNGCRYIHFEPNAEVVNTHRLTYEKAWVELALHPNRYYMVTVPLKDTYSGDWFWNDLDKVDHFTALNDETLPEKRVTPTIYQRVWDFPVTDVINSNGTQTQVKSTQWSLPYNYLATKYETNSGGYNFNAVSVWVHPSTPANNEEGDKNGVYKFRFPKEHTLYYYYDKNGSSVGLSESIERNKAQAGRFIYESEDSTVTFPYIMRFTNDQMQSGEHDVFFVGNPFMSHIDVNRFYEVNPHLTDILVGADNQYKHLEYKEASTGVIATSDVIAPMQSFLVRQKGDAPSCTITFTEDMLVSAPHTELTSSPEDAPNEENTISITASASDTRSSAMIRFSASASDNYREREDAEILIENETPPAVAIFTTVEDRALDIQQRANGGEIPLGMYLPKPEDVTLRIAVPDEYSGWMVEDVETNRRYPLMPGEETEIHVGRLTTNVGRFYLKGQSATGNETITATQPRLYCYREAGSHTLVVRSGSEMMTRCEVYGMDGRLRHIGQFETDEYRFPAQEGVQIVKAYFKDGITSTVKVF